MAEKTKPPVRKRIPKMNKQEQRALQIFQNAAALSRSMLANRLGTQFDGKRDLYESFGYPRYPQYEDYRNLYDRQGLATRAVEIFADDTWNVPPVLIDGESRSDKLDDKATPFVKEWDALAKRLSVWQILRQADVMLGFGRYSVVFMGAPGEDFSQPVDDNGLFYLAAYDEQQATISELIQDTKIEKFGMPAAYTIAFNSQDAGLEMKGGNTVHHSRVIHASENRLGSRIYGRPRLQTILNRLFDAEKVTGGGAEAAWLAVYGGLLLLAREGAELPAKDSPEGKRLDEQIQNYIHKIQRYAALTDVDVHDMGVKEVRIRDIYDVLQDDLTASIGVPKRRFFGSEVGELASSQDMRTWNGKIQSRRTNFAEPELLKPFVDWCIAHKVITPPASGDYAMEWTPVYTMTQIEEAQYAESVARGASAVTGGAPETAIDVNEWRRLIHLAPRDVQPAVDQQPDATDQLLKDLFTPKPKDPQAVTKQDVETMLTQNREDLRVMLNEMVEAVQANDSNGQRSVLKRMVSFFGIGKERK
jgi:hypothetical protein